MGKSKQCSACGARHTPPTGKKCPAMVPEEEPERDSPVPQKNDFDLQFGLIFDAVTAIHTKVESLERRVGEKAPTESPPTPSSGGADLASLRSNTALDLRTESLLGATGLGAKPPAAAAARNDVGNFNLEASGFLADIVTASSKCRSPRDAPIRKIRANILWPNHFVSRTGQSFVKYDDLSQTEWVLGMVRIVQLPELSSTESTARLTHIEQMMAAARTYQWNALRSMYAIALEAIQYGDMGWGFTFQTLKDKELHLGHLLTAVPQAASTQPTEQQAASRKEPCKRWNFNTCTRVPCPYAHTCHVCHVYHQDSTAAHKASECVKRQQYIQSRSSSGGAAGFTHTPSTSSAPYQRQ